MIFSGCCIRFRRVFGGWLLLVVLAAAQAQAYYALPGATAREVAGAVRFSYGGQRYSYAPGLGWIGLEPALSAPRVEGGRVYLTADVLTSLGVNLPKLEAVRSSGGGTVRVVLDFDDLDAQQLEPLRGRGSATPAEPLTLRLPRLLLPPTLPKQLEGLTLVTRDAPDATTLTLTGPATRTGLTYDIFPLGDPTRLVIDLTADPAADPSAGAADATLDARENLLSRLVAPRRAVRDLAAGVTLRSFMVPTLAGSSQVDLVEIAPGRGRFQVRGGSTELRTPSELTSTALVGLNASYFDPATGRSIGLLKQGGELESFPSRNRAAVGFGFGRPRIDRLSGTLELSIDGVPGPELELRGERVTLYTEPGAWVSSPRQGAVVVAASGRVLENKVGPRRVPPGGFVLSYLPDVRALALIDAGRTLSFELETRPSIWQFVPEAVEAGPLLVADGRSAYRPGLEAFDTQDRESNINRRTTRAALGVRADGTTLLLVATQLTAAELVPLFLSLDAAAALQLDSGGSSTLVVGGEVVNRPALLQRRVATLISYTPNRLP